MADIIVLDNFDSFTYNLVDQLRSTGYAVTVYRNTLSAEFIYQKLTEAENPILLLSPGPGTPRDAGSMFDLIKLTFGNYPIIGICLGHQALAEYCGAKIIPAPKIIHGKSCLVKHDNVAMYQQLPNPLSVGRYHSLLATDLPDNLVVNAKFEDLVMSFRDDQNKVFGFQFHPESILTTYGQTLLNNTINLAVNGK